MTGTHRNRHDSQNRADRRESEMNLAKALFAIACLGFLILSRTHALGAPLASDSRLRQAGQSGIDRVVFSHRFLDLDDPSAVRDAQGAALLTFGSFDANDILVRAQGFESIDAWCAHAANDPCLAGSKMQQVGWQLSGGDEAIFWQLRAIVYLCGAYENLLAAIESRPLVYNGNARTWVAPGIELTTGINHLEQYTATVFWNPSVSSGFGGVRQWDRFSPLVALAHELVHAYQRIAEDRRTYSSSLQVGAMKDENLIRYAFYRKVPGHADVLPRPGNRGFYLDSTFQYLFDNIEWLDWSPDRAPLLDVFEQQ